ncbi:MAG TPA: CBS domain-containing protein [Anaerolineales bacterium]
MPPSAWPPSSSAAARAPLTAILIVFEMTDDYRIILLLMAAVITATVVAQHLHPESIYTLKLVRRGIRVVRGRDVDVMDSVRVDEVMRPPALTVPPDMPASELAARFLATNSHAYPVVQASGKLVGIVSLSDLRRAGPDEQLAPDLTVGDIATRHLVTALPGETVRLAMERMAPRDLSRLPVVAPGGPHTFGWDRAPQ